MIELKEFFQQDFKHIRMLDDHKDWRLNETPSYLPCEYFNHSKWAWGYEHFGFVRHLNGEWYAGFSIVIAPLCFELRLIQRQCFEFDKDPTRHYDELFMLEKYEIQEFEDHYVLSFYEGGEFTLDRDILKFKITKM